VSTRGSSHAYSLLLHAALVHQPQHTTAGFCSATTAWFSFTLFKRWLFETAAKGVQVKWSWSGLRGSLHAKLEALGYPFGWRRKVAPTVTPHRYKLARPVQPWSRKPKKLT